MKFAVLTSYNAAFGSISTLTDPIKKAYCERHGYDYICRQIDSEHHPVWLRIHLILELFDSYDWIMWMDADAFITNPEIKLESLVDDSDLIITHDFNGLNAGVFLTRNTEWSRSFFRKVLEFENKHPGYGGDQIAMNRTLYVDRWEDTGVVRYPIQSTFNSYRYDLYNLKFENGQYRPGDFVLHLPGLPNEQRIEIIESCKNSS